METTYYNVNLKLQRGKYNPRKKEAITNTIQGTRVLINFN